MLIESACSSFKLLAFTLSMKAWEALIFPFVVVGPHGPVHSPLSMMRRLNMPLVTGEKANMQVATEPADSPCASVRLHLAATRSQERERGAEE